MGKVKWPTFAQLSRSTAIRLQRYNAVSLGSFLTPLPFRPNMISLFDSNFTDTTEKLSNATAESHSRNVALEVSYIFTIIINSITCPFTVLLNVLVIMAVKRRPRLQTNANNLLVCLAVTDALTGLTSQPSFILWKTFQLHRMTNFVKLMGIFHNFCIVTISVCSCLHLMLVTCERLIAIKFTMHYHRFVTKRNIRVSVSACWIFSIFLEVLGLANQRIIQGVLLALVVNSCILFVSFSDVLLYRETLKHKKRIKTQQLPQEEVERFVRESKALKTTVYVVGAVVLSFLPGASVLVVRMFGQVYLQSSLDPWLRTCGMLNSLLNPLIYCWRQQEMRRFVFRLWTIQVVHPA